MNISPEGILRGFIYYRYLGPIQGTTDDYTIWKNFVYFCEKMCQMSEIALNDLHFLL